MMSDTMSTWDCESLGTDSDIKVWAKDLSVECVDDGFNSHESSGPPRTGIYTILLLFAYISLLLYTLVPILLYMCVNRKSKCKYQFGKIHMHAQISTKSYIPHVIIANIVTKDNVTVGFITSTINLATTLNLSLLSKSYHSVLQVCSFHENN